MGTIRQVHLLFSGLNNAEDLHFHTYLRGLQGLQI